MQREKGRPRSAKYLTLWLVAGTVCLAPAATWAALNVYDTAYGTGALASESAGNYNTAYGYNALDHNTNGGSNTGVGLSALQQNTTGSSNTAVGVDSLYNTTTGGSNTAIGDGALFANTTGYSNTASGVGALFTNMTGYDNLASGYTTLHNNTTGHSNTASGVSALYSNNTGGNNTALGFQALWSNTGGNSNTAAGVNALSALTSGNDNIAIGFHAGTLNTGGSTDIYIGNPGFKGSESNVMRIGRAQTKTFIAGIKGVPLSGATVVINSAGQLGVVASSARYKKDIEPLAGSADKLAQLRPVSFRYKTEAGATHYGLIAEEVDKVMPELVVRDEKNRPESVQYQEIIPLLLQQWKAQRSEIARQRALIEQEGKELAELRRTLATRLASFDTAAKGSEVK